MRKICLVVFMLLSSFPVFSKTFVIPCSRSVEVEYTPGRNSNLGCAVPLCNISFSAANLTMSCADLPAKVFFVPPGSKFVSGFFSGSCHEDCNAANQTGWGPYACDVDFDCAYYQSVPGVITRSCTDKGPGCNAPQGSGFGGCSYPSNGSISGSCSATIELPDDVCVNYPEFCAKECDLEQIATNDSAFSTGNFGRYTLWQLSEGEKTVIPLSSLPNSSIPSPADYDQMNVAVSLDGDGNFLGYGWSGDATQAIWVDPANIEGCEPDENGYFVFNSSVEGSGGGYVYEGNCINGDCGGGGGTGGGGGGGGLPREPPDKIDTVIYYPPNTPGERPNSSPDYTPWFEKIYDKIPSLSDLKDGILDPLLVKLDSLPQKIGGIIPNPLPILQNIYNFLTGTETPDFDIPFPDLEDPNVGDLDSLIIDTIPPDTNFVFDDEEFKRNLDSILPDTLPFKKELDSLFPKEVDTAALTEKVKDALKEDIAKIKEKTEGMLEPLKNLFTGGSSGGDACECLTSGLRLGLSNGYSSFEATAYGWVMGFVCDKFILIRTIVLLIASVISLGMVLKVLRS